MTLDELMILADNYADACQVCECRKAPVSRNITREKLVMALAQTLMEEREAGRKEYVIAASLL